MHAHSNCAEFEASHTHSIGPRHRTTLRGVQTFFQTRTQRRIGVGDKRGQDTDANVPKYVVILMYGAQNSLPGEAQTQLTTNRELLIEPPKKHEPSLREEPMATVPLPSACWLLRRRPQTSLPGVCER